MIKQEREMRIEVKKQVREGKGEVTFTYLLEQQDYESYARMIAKILLKPNCSIGYHQHCGEEEVITVLQGQATYVENGKTYILNEGDTCVLHNGESHGIANETNENLWLYAIILTGLHK